MECERCKEIVTKRHIHHYYKCKVKKVKLFIAYNVSFKSYTWMIWLCNFENYLELNYADRMPTVEWNFLYFTNRNTNLIILNHLTGTKMTRIFSRRHNLIKRIFFQMKISKASKGMRWCLCDPVMTRTEWKYLKYYTSTI